MKKISFIEYLYESARLNSVKICEAKGPFDLPKKVVYPNHSAHFKRLQDKFGDKISASKMKELSEFDLSLDSRFLGPIMAYYTQGATEEELKKIFTVFYFAMPFAKSGSRYLPQPNWEKQKENNKYVLKDDFSNVKIRIEYAKYLNGEEGNKVSKVTFKGFPFGVNRPGKLVDVENYLGGNMVAFSYFLIDEGIDIVYARGENIYKLSKEDAKRYLYNYAIDKYASKDYPKNEYDPEIWYER